MNRAQSSSKTVDTRLKASRRFRLIGAGILGLLLAGGACVENLADCVEVYASTGAKRLHAYSRIACEEHCRAITGWIDCYWDG